jgi:hypothetical protein
MELATFLHLLSPDDAVRSTAAALLAEACEDPAFLFFLLSSLADSAVQSDSRLVDLLELAALHMVKTHWPPHTAFWSEEQHGEISNAILPLIFSISGDHRSHLVECYRHIVVISFPESIDLAETILRLLGESPQGSPDRTSLLQIATFWAEACAVGSIPDEIAERIEHINGAFIELFVRISSEDNGVDGFAVLQLIAKAVRLFLKKLNGSLLCEHFDRLLSNFLTVLRLDSGDAAQRKLKVSVLKLYVCLCRTFFNPQGNSLEIHIQYSEHFVSDVAPAILEHALANLQTERDQFILGYLLYVIFFFVANEVADLGFVTPAFVTEVVIPIGRLQLPEIVEMEINPLQFLAFNFSYDCSEKVITTRSVSAAIIGGLAKRPEFADVLYDFLLEPTEKQLDFEGRVFLTTAYINSTMSPRGPIVDDQVVQMLLAEAAQVTARPAWVIVSLIMFMTAVLPFFDPEAGCLLAADCILGTDDICILCAASQLLRRSIVESDTRIEMDIVAIVPKLLELRTIVQYEYLVTAVEALIQMGGEDAYPFLAPTLDGMLSLCGSSENCHSLLYRMFEIVNAIPDDAPVLIELADSVIPKCLQMFQNFEGFSEFEELFLLLSGFNSKIDHPTETMFSAVAELLPLILEDDARLVPMQNIAYMICPIILSPRFQEREDLCGAVFEAAHRFLEFTSDEKDSDSHAYSILICSTFIQTLGAQGFVFLPAILESLEGISSGSDIILFSACVFGLASALFAPECDSAETFSQLPGDVVTFVIERISDDTLRTYEELRMGMLVLLKFVENGAVNAHAAAKRILLPLIDRKDERAMTLDAKMRSAEAVEKGGEAEFPPLVVPFAVRRFDAIDEVALFAHVTAAAGMVQALDPDQLRAIAELLETVAE